MRKVFQNDDGDRAVLRFDSPGKYKAVRLPYAGVPPQPQQRGTAQVSAPAGGANFSAIALLPDSASTSVRSLLSTLDVTALANSRAWRALKPAGLELALPKFKVESSASLKQPLQTLGVVDAFNARAAQFGRLSNTSTFVSDVVRGGDVRLAAQFHAG